MSIFVVENDRLRFGERLLVSFHRTLRVPDDGRIYPLPAGFGLFPIGQRTERPGGFCVPMYRREALWIGFSGAAWKPNAVKVLVGGVNAVSGNPDDGARLGSPQDYLVCPQQPWLDGFNAGGGVIRQFVAEVLGEGYAVEAGHGLPEVGGIDFIAFEPRPGVFPDAPPPTGGPQRLAMPRTGAGEMVLAAGGQIRQKIYADAHGADVWAPDSRDCIRVTLVDPQAYTALTGLPAPSTPIDQATYQAANIPWFALYDEDRASVSPAGGAPRRTAADHDRTLGREEPDASVAISPTGVHHLRTSNDGD